MSASEKLIVALDVPDLERASTLVDQLSDSVHLYKVGSQLFTAFGPSIIYQLMDQGKGVFLDLKFHDIPNTVANALESVVHLNKYLESNKNDRAQQGVFMCTLHTVGGEEMMRRAVTSATQTAERNRVKRPLIVGITVLTSDVKTDNIRDIVLQRAALAKKSGLDGVVASVNEAAMIRDEFGPDFVIVTPGIRPVGEDVGDQKRVSTPSEAVKQGSHYLVVGRPIVKSANPQTSAQDILNEITLALHH